MRVPRGIALLGGTFDPVHAGHVALAREALECLCVARVEFLPAGNPWQKGGVTAGHHRLAMLEALLANEDRLSVNPTELMRSGPTYTVETLSDVRRRIGPSQPLVLLMGSDQWANLGTWRDWRRLTDYAHLAVASRGGVPPRGTPEVEVWASERMCAAARLTERPSGSVAFFEMEPHAASSTRIRRLLTTEPPERALRSVEDWLGLPVARYIRENRLYVRARQE